MIDLDQYNPAHAFLIQGSELDFEMLTIIYHDRGVLELALTMSRCTVEDAQTIVTFNMQSNGQERWCIAYFPVFSPEAAQALLKTLEEPSVGTRIAFVTPYPYLIPLTIRSRTIMVNTPFDTFKKAITKKDAEAVIKDTLADDHIDAADRKAHAIALLDALEQHVAHNHVKARAIYKAKDLLFKANIPVKQVAEYAVDTVF